MKYSKTSSEITILSKNKIYDCTTVNDNNKRNYKVYGKEYQYILPREKFEKSFIVIKKGQLKRVEK